MLLTIMACETSDKNPLEAIMASDAPQIKKIVDNLPKHEVQILYTQIDRDEQGNPVFTEHGFQLDSMQYFYPASTAKMPVAVLSLQKLNELKRNGKDISKESPFTISSYDNTQVLVEKDSTEENGKLTTAHLIKKIFLVSDNDAYNYLFDFLGRDYVNEQLQSKSIGPAHINHKFLYGADNSQTWPMLFSSHDSISYVQQGIQSQVDRHSLPLKGIIKGVGYTDNDGKLFNEPFDFTEKNYFSIQGLNKIMKAIIFPESLPENERFGLIEEDYEFLRFWMSRNALESEYPNYNDGEHWDSYVKFFMYGDTKQPMPKNIRIYNKVGMAYGTLTDVAYIQDKENDVEFILTATVHINENGIFNDGIYEYDELGLPFLAELGRQVYQYELERK
ncbi:MAG: serine hydrolase [Roseivirga sp.]|nr:serine hydrolase [Roseivirga sp.]